MAVQFQIAADHYREFMHEMVLNARMSRQAGPGCLVFDVCEDPQQAGSVFLQ